MTNRSFAAFASLRGTSLAAVVVVSALAGVWAARLFIFPDPAPLFGESRNLMGTVWKIQLVGKWSGAAQAAADAFDEVARVESVMSEWRPDSPLSAINAAGGNGLVEVPAELSEILRRSVGYGDLSGGAFDVTWRGMGSLWRFDDSFRVPSEEEIREAMARVDYRRIVFDGNRVGLAQEGMAIGLGGIAKGYGVDRAAAVLHKRGFENYLVDGGGDVRVSGRGPEGAWRVGIRNPRGGRRDLIAVLQLSAGAVASSGDYERYREVDGVRYHHIIDPRTGRPARGCRAVTVLAPTAEEADALATAIFVLGPEKGLKLAEGRPATEVLIVDDQGERVETPGFGDFAQRRKDAK